MSAKAEMILAVRPISETIETAWLFKSHFGAGHDAIRFNDGINSAYHSERDIAWQPSLPLSPTHNPDRKEAGDE